MKSPLLGGSTVQLEFFLPGATGHRKPSLAGGVGGAAPSTNTFSGCLSSTEYPPHSPSPREENKTNTEKSSLKTLCATSLLLPERISKIGKHLGLASEKRTFSSCVHVKKH